MIITKETDYALRILRALAGKERVTASQLAQGEQIPQQFAYKILKKLEKGGLIRILRGAEGGCVLAAELEKVSLFRLMQIMEEDSSVSSCMKPGYQCTWCKAHGDTVCQVNIHLAAIQKKLDEELEAHCLQKILFGD
ncbi:RrF2 family transcriptional regulator [Oscillospiraceae bacterium LTW-04]|nr:Rrf2 family transcriptional regulator [Oscillospiraceae bacterium MB24-C1]